MEFPKEYYCFGADFSDYGHHVPAPAFRKAFSLPKPPAKAELLITGLGFYELFVNGQRITKGYLAPYICNSDDVIYFDRYDLAPYLNAGENVIGVLLGSGMQNGISAVWDFDTSIFRSAPKWAAAVRIFAAGEELTLSAADFACAESEIRFENLRSGVHCDARLRQKGWLLPGYDDSAWKKPLRADPPRGEAKLCAADPIRVCAERKPVSIRRSGLASLVTRNMKDRERNVKPVEPPQPRTGGWLYDFGVDSAGIFRLKIRGQRGQRIEITCVECLTDGDADCDRIAEFYPEGYCQRDIYICSGEGEEVWEPFFTYHGFRYCYVTGLTEEQATPELLTYLEMHSAMQSRAQFACSDPVANRLFEIILRTDLANFYYFPTDCPHREKNGWTGDANLSAEHMTLTLTPEANWHEWLLNIRKAQNDRGELPGIVPTSGWGFAWGNGPAWDNVLFQLPYCAYRYRGDTAIIRENAHAMLRYLQYIAQRRDENGIIACGLGDWCMITSADNQPEAPLGFTDSVTVYSMCCTGEEMFRAVGDTLEAAFAHALGKELRAAVRKQYLDAETMRIAGGFQTSQAMGLFYGIFDADECAAAFEQLVRQIHHDGDSMHVGVLGARVLFHVLSDYGRSDLAYQLITKPDFPSYGYFLQIGETSLPESFYPLSNSTGSHLHHFFGDVNHWFLRHIAGLNVNPSGKNPNEILIRPSFPAALTWAEASYDAPAGKVTVRWERSGSGIRLKIRQAAGVCCIVDPALQNTCAVTVEVQQA